MRILKNLATAAAVASLAVAPVMAQASGASMLSLRTSTKAKGSSKLGQAQAGLFVSLALVGVIVGISELSDSP